MHGESETNGEGEKMGTLESLTETKVKKMAGDKVFSRGFDYFVRGYVREIIKTEKDVKAKVLGRKGTLYSVYIRGKGKRLESNCTCPFGGFCKHIVAVLLSLMKKSGDITQISMKEVKDNLLSKSKGELVGMILNHASSDTDFMKSLVETHIKVKKAIDVSFFKREIDRRLDEADYVQYPGVFEYAIGLERFAEQIQSLAKSGFAREASELLFYFLKQSVDTYENSGIDDSGGDFGDFITSLGEPCAKALKASGGKGTISADDIVDLYIKAADYGVDDSLEPILKVLPEETLLRAEELARERVERVKDKAESWRSTDERFLLVTILALLGKREEYTKLCKEWGEKEWIAELKEFEKRKRVKQTK